MKNLMKLAAAVAVISAAVVAAIAYREEIKSGVVSFLDRMTETVKEICPCKRKYYEDDCFADIEE